MSSPSVHSAQSTSQHGRQWWSRKQNSVSHRTPSSAASDISHPSRHVLDEKQQIYPVQSVQKSGSNTKFHTFASVMRFKSKKQPGMASLGLQQHQSQHQHQQPHQHLQPPQKLRLNTSKQIHQSSIPVAGRSRAQTIDTPPGKPVVPPVVIKSPTELASIRTGQSSVESPEPLTPSDGPRNRSSYQPSLFTYSEHDPLPDFMRPDVDFSLRHDLHRASVMSDPSIVDPHIKRVRPNTLSREFPISSDVVGPSTARSSRSRLSDGLSPSPGTSLGRAVNSERCTSQPSVLKSPPPRHASHEWQARDNSLMQVTSSLKRARNPIDGQKYSATTYAVPSSSRRREESLSDSVTRTRAQDIVNVSAKDVLLDQSAAAVTVAAHTLRSQPSNSSMASRPSVRTSPSFSSSHTPTLSLMDANSVSSSTMRRQGSTARLRTIPPSRTPPPTQDLPPTPETHPPSPVTFKTPKRPVSPFNSTLSLASDDTSILSVHLPRPSSSSSSSSSSLCFASPQSPDSEEQDQPASSMRSGLRDALSRPRSPAVGPRHTKEGQKPHRATTPHGAKSPSQHPTRGESTSTIRTLKKSASQQSFTTRPRMNSITSGHSVLSDESPGISPFKNLRKQRSLHMSRSTTSASIQQVLPLPPQLRHSSSFNAATTLVTKGRSVSASHNKEESSSSVLSGNTIGSAQGAPSSPQKKRHLFSHERRDHNERNRDRDVSDSHYTARSSADGPYSPDRNKRRDNGHGSGLAIIGLGLQSFTMPFSASNSSSTAHLNVYEGGESPGRPRSPSFSDPVLDEPPPTPVKIHANALSSPPVFVQHILPPAELLSRMEALTDTEPPSSPHQFSDAMGGEDDQWNWDMVDKFSIGSSVTSRSSTTSSSYKSSGRVRASSSSSRTGLVLPLTTRHFASPTASIQGRLQGGDRPSSSSRIPIKNTSLSLPYTDSTRPSTAQPAQPRSSSESVTPVRSTFTRPPTASNSGNSVTTGLPPPPRRRGAAVSNSVVSSNSTTTRVEQRRVSDNGGSTTQMPPSRVSVVSQTPSLPLARALPPVELEYSNSSNKTYSVYRKPSFLNIDDEPNDTRRRPISAVPEDSFLILDGKDSLDLSSSAREAFVTVG